MTRKLWMAAVLLLAVLAAAEAAVAQDSHVYSATLLGGYGGAFDASPDSGLSNTSYQIGFSMLTDVRQLIDFRAGRMRFADRGLGSLAEADLDYFTVAGEYRFAQTWYDYGIYLGLGDYRVDGRRADQQRESQNALGLVLGLTGDFRVTKWLSVVGEVSAHYAFLHQANVFGQALGGLAFHF